MEIPTAARFMNDAEWAIVSDVFRSTIWTRYRILITNGAGDENRPFTIPTAAISLLTIPAAAQAALSGFVTAKLGAFGGALASVGNFLGTSGPYSLPSQIAGQVNLGYIMSVGPHAYPNMAVRYGALLVHETAHVWQGVNSRSSMTYVLNSIMHQCRSMASTSSHEGAYDVEPGGIWMAYNAEQQATLIEKWYVDGRKEEGPIWPYIRNYVRAGIV